MIAELEALYEPIGRLIVLWAYFEGQIDQEIEDLRERLADESTSADFRRQRFVWRLKRWRRLSLRAYPQQQDQQAVSEIYSLAQEIKPVRDRVAHGRWAKEIEIIRDSQAAKFTKPRGI